MSEKELAKALLRVGVDEPTTKPDVDALTRRILERDRRRLAWLTGATVAFWLGTVAVFYWFVVSLIGGFDKMREAGLLDDPVLSNICDYLLLLSAGVEGLFFAFLCAFLLLIASRRATLRQTNAALVRISAQIEGLRREPMERASQA